MTDRKRGLFAVIAAMVVVNLVYGLILPLLSLILDAQGIGKTIIGLSIVAQFCAGVVIAPFGPLVLIATGASGLLPFVVTASLIMLASIPLAWLQNEADAYGDESQTSLWPIFRLVPHILPVFFYRAHAD